MERKLVIGRGRRGERGVGEGVERKTVDGKRKRKIKGIMRGGNQRTVTVEEDTDDEKWKENPKVEECERSD